MLSVYLHAHRILSMLDVLHILFKYPLHTWPTQDLCKSLDYLADNFDAASFDWKLVKPMGLVNHCASEARSNPTCGRILARCQEKVTSFRETVGIRVCVFKLGVSSNPLKRFIGYRQQGFDSMWVIAVSHSLDLIHMLEAGLVALFHQHVGCRNKSGTGGEGALNKKDKAPPPYFMYVTGARADQFKRIGGWKNGRVHSGKSFTVVPGNLSKYGGMRSFENTCFLIWIQLFHHGFFLATLDVFGT